MWKAIGKWHARHGFALHLLFMFAWIVSPFIFYYTVFGGFWGAVISILLGVFLATALCSLEEMLEAYTFYGARLFSHILAAGKSKFSPQNIATLLGSAIAWFLLVQLVILCVKVIWRIIMCST